MLRTLIFVSWILILCSIDLSQAADCTTTTFSQNIDATQLASAKMTPEDYTSATQQQITGILKNQFGEIPVNVNCTMKKASNTVSVAYQVIYACNETITTTTATGSSRTTTTTSKVDTSKVQQADSCGKFTY